MNQGAPPPAGGFGGQPHGGAGPIAPPNPPRGGAGAAAAGTSIVLVVILVVVGVLVVGGGIVAVLAIYGTRKYIANAKTAEARNSLGQIAKDAVVAYEGETLGETPQAHALCRSASQPVPMNASSVSGRKYQSMRTEWVIDQNRPHTGFACLRFEMTAPQYYQYDYHATTADFTGRARGDLDGDGTFSTFEVRGQVQGDRLLIAPSILETSPEE